ncbi:hypothetical protein QL285_037531 [Trifolium repens]|nr:hypothetical protein QL285_037531 [Trifolium repens]
MFDSITSEAGPGASIHHHCNTCTSNSKKTFSAKPPFFNGDATNFSWWKAKVYSHIIGIDDELCDLVDEGVVFHLVDICLTQCLAQRIGQYVATI